MPRFLPSVSSIAILVCSPAVAQVSAADLWAEWQATSAAVGQQMTATVTQTADGLVLDNFMTRTEADGTTTTGPLDRVTMTEMPTARSRWRSPTPTPPRSCSPRMSAGR
jgi:hypothetical protein